MDVRLRLDSCECKIVINYETSDLNWCCMLYSVTKNLRFKRGSVSQQDSPPAGNRTRRTACIVTCVGRGGIPQSWLEGISGQVPPNWDWGIPLRKDLGPETWEITWDWGTPLERTWERTWDWGNPWERTWDQRPENESGTGEPPPPPGVDAQTK